MAAAAAATATAAAAAGAVSQGHLTRTTGVMRASARTPAHTFRGRTSALVSAEGGNRLAGSMCRMGLTRGCSPWDHGKIERRVAALMAESTQMCAAMPGGWTHVGGERDGFVCSDIVPVEAGVTAHPL